MLPYNNTGKYHETPEGIPMLHTIDHGLTETMFSLSPSSQFMYEPEMLESTSCGQTQAFAGPSTSEIKSEKDSRRLEGIINPSVERMTFQDCVVDHPDGLFGLPSTDCLTFQDQFELETNFAPSVGGLGFIDRGKSKEAFRTPGKSSRIFDTTLERITCDDVINADNGFDVLSEGINFDANRQLDLFVPPTADGGVFDMEGIENDWFELDKDICEMSKVDCLLQDTIFGDGPTLTQLNSKDLDSTLLDEFNVLNDLYASNAALIGGGMQPYSSSGTAPVPIPVSKLQPMGSHPSTTLSPKFTTCTITSFMTSVSQSLPNQPPYPVYLTNDLPLVVMKQDPGCNTGSGSNNSYLMRGMAKDHCNDMTELVLRQMSGSAAYASPCFVPVLSDGTHTVGLVQTVVVPGAAVSVVVPEPASNQAPCVVSDDRESLQASLDKKWEEIEQFIQSSEDMEPEVADVNQYRKALKMESNDVAFNPLDETSDKEDSALEDSDIEDADVDNSDEDSVNLKSEYATDFATTGRKEKKYFWQYNTQSKGPKGKRLCKSVETEDPHVLHDFEDPVFDPEQNQTRYKHNGKARRGDGNDVTPYPHKLFVTGNELKKLNKLINAITPTTDVPASMRAKMLKEKNKYASRACRLKKKAQHEANKLKLHGLELEHRQLMRVIGGIKKEIIRRVASRNEVKIEPLSSKLESLIQQHHTLTIAGRTAEYVNSVLQKVANGDKTGGITVDE